MRSESQWRAFGDLDPYFGVVSWDKFRAENLTEQRLDEFWQSGREHVAHIQDVFRQRFGIELRTERTLDFGCGVGRILRPLYGISQSIMGVDVSPGMLAEARKNCPDADFAEKPSGTFDFIHSFIVLQHIERRKGMAILKDLISRLRPGGYAAIHITYQRDFRTTLRMRFPILVNLLRGRKWSYPGMRMEEYSLPAVLSLVPSSNLVVELTDHCGVKGCTLYFQKPI